MRRATSVFFWLTLGATIPVALAAQAAANADRDRVEAADVRLDFPLGLAFAPEGALYVSERRNHRVWRWDPASNLAMVVAGTGERGFSGDGGPARAAQLFCPDSIDVDDAGNLFIADRCNGRIRRVDAESGVITTVAGNGERGPAPDAPALDVALTGPFYVHVESAGAVLLTDTDAHLVRRLDLRSGRLSTLAGSGQGGFGGDGGPALEASLSRPHVVIRARNGDLVIGDSFNLRIRRVDHGTGRIRTIAGSGEEGAAADGMPALEAPFHYFGDMLELDDGDLLVTEWVNGRVVRLDRAAGRLRVVAGSTDTEAPGRDGLDPLETRFGPLAGLAMDSSGRIYVAATNAGLVRRIDLKRRVVETVIGSSPP